MRGGGVSLKTDFDQGEIKLWPLGLPLLALQSIGEFTYRPAEATTVAHGAIS